MKKQAAMQALLLLGNIQNVLAANAKNNYYANKENNPSKKRKATDKNCNMV